ncbi:hypothetical protein JCM10213_003289 [Rhodosporidiobolus nylandii]
MLDRPSLSINVGRRPSFLQTATANAAGSVPSSPLCQTPVTPLNEPASWLAMSGAQTPLIQPGLFPPGAGAFPGRRGLLRRNSSLSSVSSNFGEEDDEDEPEWTEEEEAQVLRVFDACLEEHYRTEAPFAPNAAPPPNFTNMVARAVLRSQNAPGRTAKAPIRTRAARARKAAFALAGASPASSDVESEGSEVEMDAPAPRWKHSMRSTRLKVISLAKERQSEELQATPRQSDPDATPKRRKPLARQDSMDFLPDMHNSATITRLGNMLRQPSSDLFPSATPMAPSRSASGACTPPVAPSAFSHVPSSRMRVQRTNSLHSIAGSPSQPKKSSNKRAALGSPEKSSPIKQDAAGSTKRLARFGSESSVLPAPSLSRTLSFEPNQRSSQRPPLGGSSYSDPTALSPCTVSSPFTPPPSAERTRKAGRSSFFNFASPTPLAPPPPFGRAPAPAVLSLDAAALSLKRPQGGLASAFHSPITGCFPASPPNSAPRQKKKAKVGSFPSPVRKPSFGASLAPPPAPAGADPLALGLGLGLGGMSLDLERSPSPMMSEEPEQVTLVEPLPGMERRESGPPPKLVLTPSLSPASSSSSISLSRASSSSGSNPATPSHELGALNLATSSPAKDFFASPDMMSPMQTAAAEGAFLHPEFVKAGHEASRLSEAFGEFSWAVGGESA